MTKDFAIYVSWCDLIEYRYLLVWYKFEMIIYIIKYELSIKKRKICYKPTAEE